MDAPDLGTPGEAIPLRWKVANTGNLDAVSIPYQITFAPTEAHSPAWPSAAEGALERLAMGEEAVLLDQVHVPSDAEPGLYYLTIEANPDGSTFEHVRTDNFALSNPIVVSHEDLVILTERLPMAQFQGHYGLRLQAAGGDGSHLWRLEEGSVLPPGLSLVEEEGANASLATFLRGVPSRVGTFEFALVVTSGGVTARRDYTLEVSALEHGLAVTTENLANGAFGFPYRDELSAIGGVPPYTWEARAELPLGLLLRSDGVLSGRPQRDGPFEIPFRVRDSLGREATRKLTLQVAAPSALTCVTQALPTVSIGEEVEVQLVAAGGQKGEGDAYLWTSESATRLATEIGERSEPLDGPPPGYSLQPNGVVRIAPTEFGSYVWDVQVQDGSAGAQPATCSIRVDVPRDRGLSVVTTRLPTAVVGRSYRAALEASGGDGTLTWWEYEGGRILDELKLEFDASGDLFGTPPLEALDGAPYREFTVTVRVKDELNRIGVGVLTLGLSSGASEAVETREDEGGCQTSSGGAAPWALALLGLALLRRRR